MELSEESIKDYKKQLEQINYALSIACNEGEKEELLTLRESIQELLSLATENEVTNVTGDSASEKPALEDEYALFMAEMAKEGAYETDRDTNQDLSSELKALEGTKCRAPHKHQWGTTVYHNAMITSIIPPETSPQVRVLYTNPTHQEMLPCPYYLESNGCKFTEEKCRYSHGEIVPFESIQEYVAPQFELLTKGSNVLAKKSDNLWYRALIKNVYDGKCMVTFESNRKDVELDFEDVLPLPGDIENHNTELEIELADEEEDLINVSLLNDPGGEALGNWEKHTKGIGSKLMQKMGYIIGTGLGRKSDGRLSPVTAVILPAGKSLDHCMALRERANGDKDLFSVERKLKRLQKKQEIRNQKAYERSLKQEKRVDVFTFLNKTLSGSTGSDNVNSSKRDVIKKETGRNLNVASLKTDEDIKRIEREIYVVKDSLTRHADVTSQVNKKLNEKLYLREKELEVLQKQALQIKNEQRLREDKKKLTVF